MQANRTTRDWLAVEWHLGSWWQIVTNFFAQCNGYSSLVGNNHYPLPGDVYGSLPGNTGQCPASARLQPLPWTLARSLPGNVCQCASPAWARLQSLPGTLASSVPGNVCQCPALARFAVSAWDALTVPCLGTFANALPGQVCQSLPGTLCQFPAWERLPMPCLGMFASSCLGRLPVPCLVMPFSATLSLAELFSYAYRPSMRRELLRLLKPDMQRIPLPCYFVYAIDVK